ncbi:MAG: hypothetical protein NVSMB65_16300 [Chloroflexota bacterium]
MPHDSGRVWGTGMVAYWVIRLAALLSRVVPLRVRYALGAAVCDLAYLVWVPKRRNTVRNARVVLGSARRAPRVARASWRNYGLYLIDFLRLPVISREEILRSVHVVDWSGLDAALAAGHGAIFVTAHYGCWDMAPTLIDDRYPGRVYAAAETFEPARLNDLVQGHRLAKGLQVIPAETGTRQMIRVLRRNNVLALVVDRPVHGDEGGVEVTFFGRPTMVPAGAATLALLTGAPILPGYLRRVRGAHYESRMGDAIAPVATGDRAADVQRLTQQFMAQIELMVRERPSLWYMFRSFWPPDEAMGTAEPPREAFA